MLKQITGLTFIELLIVLCILGILSAIAYPTYTVYLIKAHRVDGETALLELASQLERNYITSHSYLMDLKTQVSQGGWYELKIEATANSYLLSAIPIKSQINDHECGTLTLDNFNVKGQSGHATIQTCWG